MGPTGENDVTDAVRARSSVTTQRIGAKSNPFMRETTPPGTSGQAYPLMRAPACPGIGEGRESHGVNVSPMASNAAREIRSDPQRLLEETPHLPNRKLTRCHQLPRINTFRSNK